MIKLDFTMKNMILIFSMLITLSSCSDDSTDCNATNACCSDDSTDKQESSDKRENPLIGAWQLIRRTANNIDGSPNNWENIDNGHNIFFREHLNYESNEFTACENNINQGIFKLNQVSNDNIIKNVVEIVINNCQNKSSGIFVRLFYYSFNKNDLVLVPKEPACPEGCAFLYKKME